jgi:small subunit ribosomal protein S20
MPVTKSARKAARQALGRTERNKGTKSQLKTFVKKVLELSKTDVSEAKKVLPKAYSVIDKASKKNIIHKNNAARKKSRLARVVANAEKKS